jgi:hypothetical protein
MIDEALPQQFMMLVVNLDHDDPVYLKKHTTIGFYSPRFLEPVEEYEERYPADILGRSMQSVNQIEILPRIPEDTNLLFMGDISRKREILLRDANTTPETKQKMSALLRDYEDVMSSGNNDIGHTKLFEAEILTDPTAKPPASRPYPLALKHQDWVRDDLEDLLERGIIQRSFSPYALPILIVPKRAPPGAPVKETKRMVIDYRRLNSIGPEVDGPKNKGALSLVPLPKIDDMLATLKDAKFFSKLDMRSGYYHIKLSEATRHKTAFVCMSGKQFATSKIRTFALANSQLPNAYYQHGSHRSIPRN